jgi:hypothetical protein
MILKLGSKGEMVKTLQAFLKINVDGDFGSNTQVAVKRFQRENGLDDDGVVGSKTWALMGIATTDASERVQSISVTLDIKQSYLPSTEYFPGPVSKEWLFLHHTAGWNNPYNVVKDWATDARGPIATEFVVGGQSIKGNDNSFDGEVVQTFPAGGYGWHLGLGHTPMHKNSVGIEVCSFGQLSKGGYNKEIDGVITWIAKEPEKFYTYVGTEANANQIVDIKSAFRGYTHWHRYSDKQLTTLKELIQFIAKRDGINVRNGLPDLIRQMGIKAFDFCDPQKVATIKGLWCHANVMPSKVDMYPQQELVDMLLSL